jgi:hypothetical protein
MSTVCRLPTSAPVSLMIIAVTLLVTVMASLAKVRRNPEVYATHDVTGRHHPPWGRAETGTPSRDLVGTPERGRSRTHRPPMTGTS